MEKCESAKRQIKDNERLFDKRRAAAATRAAAAKAAADADDETAAAADTASHWSTTKLTAFEPPPCPYLSSPTAREPALLRNSTRFKTPLDFFSLLFTPEVIETIVRETNRSLAVGAQSAVDHAMHCSPPTTATEIRATLAAILFMGSVRLENLSDYWSDGALGQGFMKSRYSRNRFEAVYGHLNTDFRRPTAENKGNLFQPVQSFVTSMNANFASAVQPGIALVVDETMIKFRGDHPSVQHMPKKPIRIGFKCWSLALVNGYMLHLKLYEGKKSCKESKVASRPILPRTRC